MLGKGFDIDSHPEAPPVAKQIATALKAQSGRVLDFFRELDTSGDGVVTRSEFKKTMMKLGLRVPGAINDLFDDWDIDKDGTITFEELKKVLK